MAHATIAAKARTDKHCRLNTGPASGTRLKPPGRPVDITQPGRASQHASSQRQDQSAEGGQTKPAPGQSTHLAILSLPSGGTALADLQREAQNRKLRGRRQAQAGMNKPQHGANHRRCGAVRQRPKPELVEWVE